MKSKMRSICLFLASTIVAFSLPVSAAEKPADTALLLIDIQDFYFPGGRSALVDPEPASLNAQKLLRKFRGKKMLVVHVRHIAEKGAEIHKNVRPVEGEKVVSKKHVNCFKDTDLLEYLKEKQVKKLVICGMMTHMCVEAAVRAASDYDFEVTLIHDACATRALKFGEREVSAADVHASTLSSLNRYYARALDTETFLKDF
jgi:nicotinamidase-related amidase